MLEGWKVWKAKGPKSDNSGFVFLFFVLFLAAVSGAVDPDNPASEAASSNCPSQARVNRLKNLFGTADFTVEHLALPAEPPDEFTVTVQHLGKPKKVHLYRHNVRGKNFQVLAQKPDGSVVQIDPGPQKCYRGYINDDAESLVAASLLPTGLRARVIPRFEPAWTIHPVQDFDPGADRTEHIVCSQTDVELQNIHDWASQNLPATIDDAPVAYYNPSTTLKSTCSLAQIVYTGTTNCNIMEAEIGFDVEYKYYSAPLPGGGNFDADTVITNIETSVNETNIIYERDVLITHAIGRIIIRTDSSNCPYYNITGTAGDWLVAMRDEWNTNQADSDHDVATLVAYQFGGGVAWVAVIGTDQQNRYNVSGASSDGTFHHVMRHELGHNWSAYDYHDGCAEGATLMCGNSLSINRFAKATAEDILAYRDTRLTELVNIGPYPGDLPPRALPDNSFIDQQGLDAAGGILTVDVLANDFDNNCDQLFIADFDTTTTMGATVTLSPETGPDGRDELLYTPPPGFFVGTDTFNYTTADGTELEDTETVTVSIKMSDIMQGYWKLDETSGSLATDSSYSRADGTLKNGLSFDSDAVTGQYEGALQFDGADDHIEIPPLYFTSDTVTISAWIKRNGNQNEYTGIVFSRANDTKAGLNLSYNDKLGYHWNGSHWWWDSGLTVPDNQWVFAALVVQPDHATLYLYDGSMHPSTRWADHYPDVFDGVFRIGTYDVGWSRFFNGTIDDARVYDYAMTQSQLLDTALKKNAEAITPRQAATEVLLTEILTWEPGTDAVQHDIYLGTDYEAVASATTTSDQYVTRQSATSYNPQLEPKTMYFWRIDEITSTDDIILGQVWWFTTGGLGLFPEPIENSSFEDETAWWNPTPSWFDYDAGLEEWQAFQETESSDGSNIPLTPYGVVWGALRPAGIHWQQIGTYQPNRTYKINVLLGNRDTWTNGGIKVSLWAGGNSNDASDDTTPAMIGAIMVAESETLITDNIYSGPETKEVVTVLSTPSGLETGLPLWIRIVNANQEGISYFDNVRIIMLRDGRGGLDDFSVLAENWLNDDCDNCEGVDLTDDGNVNLADLLLFTDNWLAGI